MQHTSEHKYVHKHVSFMHSSQELSHHIKLCMEKHSRYKANAVNLRVVGSLWVLADGHEESSAEQQKESQGDHRKRRHEPTPIQVHSALPQVAGSERLGSISRKSSIYSDNH